MRFGDGRDWFFEKRFGLFVHWGLYAIPAWHEQLQWRGVVPRREYIKLLNRFNPKRFDPEAWLDLAQEAGMEYACFTTKHHDGFCLWDTAQTAFNVMNTPYRRDTLGMLSDACHRRGMPLCLYYSVADWNHPNYPNQNRSHELAGPEPGDDPDLPKYKEFLKAQVRELCTHYGEIHGIWWDMNVTGDRDTSINNMIRELQPKAVINGRGFDEGDFATPERDYESSAVNAELAFEKPVEACQSVGLESWGYKSDEDYYTDRHLLQSIDGIWAKAGKYLLNVGPKADGTFPREAVRILRTIGAWHTKVREAFDGCVPASQETENRDVLLTRKGTTVYVHLHHAPPTCRVLLKPFDTLPRRATLLNTGHAVDVSMENLPSLHSQPRKAYLRLRNLPANRLAGTVMVVKLEFD
ncbi:MAG: glycoside hydrolase [Lentisphaerae bacterium RIFOXYA12_64_32]|nr:MAG: glycoside hydrolase [Lentisphaerae bacterium RIFOXYA12_64_32]